MDSIEILRDYHSNLLRYMRQREGEIVKFWAVLFSALGTFGWAIKFYNSDLLFISIISFICILILAWGITFASCLSYHHRCFQKVMSEIESKIGLKDYLPTKWHFSKNKNFSLWDFLPEVYRWHIIYLFIAVILIIGISVCKTLSILYIWQRWILFIGIIILLGSIFHFRLFELRRKFEKLYHKKKCETETKGFLLSFLFCNLHIKRLRKTN